MSSTTSFKEFRVPIHFFIWSTIVLKKSFNSPGLWVSPNRTSLTQFISSFSGVSFLLCNSGGLSGCGGTDTGTNSGALTTDVILREALGTNSSANGDRFEILLVVSVSDVLSWFVTVCSFWSLSLLCSLVSAVSLVALEWTSLSCGNFVSSSFSSSRFSTFSALHAGISSDSSLTSNLVVVSSLSFPVSISTGSGETSSTGFSLVSWLTVTGQVFSSESFSLLSTCATPREAPLT